MLSYSAMLFFFSVHRPSEKEKGKEKERGRRKREEGREDGRMGGRSEEGRERRVGGEGERERSSCQQTPY